MIACRPLTENEIQLMINHFDTVTVQKNRKCNIRNKAMFLLGISTGLRINELRGLKIKDVYAKGKVLPDIYLEARETKTQQARSVPLNINAHSAIQTAITWQKQTYGSISPDDPLFPSRKGFSITRMGVYGAFNKAFRACGIQGNVSASSMRKTFATRLYEATKCIYTVKEILGHVDIEKTKCYIGIPYEQLHKSVNLPDMSISVLMSS